jgi:cell division protein FtsI (penicillin-binding protein 3)
MEPVLLRRVMTANGEVVRETAPRVRRRVVSKRVARQLAEMLIAVTEDGGTGTEASLDGHRVAGKTATAQKTDPRTGRYSLDDYVASFTGFVPADDPVVAITVTVDEPRVEHAGGSVAAPVFRNVAKMVLRYKGVVPRGTRPVELKELAQKADPARATQAILASVRGEQPVIQEIKQGGRVRQGQARIPDLTGVPMRSALKQLSELGLLAHVEGSGLLAKQEPPPGTVAAKGSSVKLLFRPAS